MFYKVKKVNDGTQDSLTIYGNALTNIIKEKIITQKQEVHTNKYIMKHTY